MPKFLSRFVGGSHPRGHLHRLNVLVYNATKRRWNRTYAAFEPGKPNCLIRTSFAKRMGLAPGNFSRAKIRLFEFYASKGLPETTTDIDLLLKVVDDGDFRNYNQLGLERVHLVLGKDFNAQIAHLSARNTDYIIEFDNEKIRCTEGLLPGREPVI